MVFVSNMLGHNTIQCKTIQYNTMQNNTIQYNTIPYNTIQYNTIRGSSGKSRTGYMINTLGSKTGYTFWVFPLQNRVVNLRHVWSQLSSPLWNLKASELFLIVKEGFWRSFEKILILMKTLQIQINSFLVMYNAYNYCYKEVAWISQWFFVSLLSPQLCVQKNFIPQPNTFRNFHTPTKILRNISYPIQISSSPVPIILNDCSLECSSLRVSKHAPCKNSIQAKKDRIEIQSVACA